MTAITEKANEEFRDKESPGSVAYHWPEKVGIRELFAVIDVALASLGVNGAITVKKATKALLDADLAHVADTLAVVYNDATSSNNGIYAKVGGSGSGSWSLTNLALPASFADDLATVLAQIEEVAANAEASAEDAASAATSASAANTAKVAAETARDEAVAAAELTGPFVFYQTKALANAALAGLPANQQVQVWQDESQGGAHTAYVKSGGVYVLMARFSVTEARLTVAFGEAHPFVLAGNPAWRSIPSTILGFDIPATVSPIYLGFDGGSGYPFVLDSLSQPATIARRRALGTIGSPTNATIAGTQIGADDFCAYVDGKFVLSGSWDVVVDGAIGVTPGDNPPPTMHRWAYSTGTDLVVGMQLRAERGALELFDGVDGYVPAWGTGFKSMVHSTVSDYNMAIISVPTSGVCAGPRVHLGGETSSDIFMFFSSGAGGGTKKIAMYGNGSADFLGGLRITGAAGSSGYGSEFGGSDPLAIVNSSGLTRAAFGSLDNSGAGYSGTGAVFYVGANTTTSRSINAGGTVNVSGADLAEYMEKDSLDQHIVAAQVCGVTAEAKVTTRYADAIAFAIKSTDPALVGNDVWWQDESVGERPIAPPKPEPLFRDPPPPVGAFTKPEPEGDDLNARVAWLRERQDHESKIRDRADAVEKRAEAVAAYEAEMAAWEPVFAAYEADLAAWEERLEAMRATVDRIAFAGQVPVAVSGPFAPGDYIMAERDGDGIKAVAVKVADLDFEKLSRCVGRIWSVTKATRKWPAGLAWAVVKHG